MFLIKRISCPLFKDIFAIFLKSKIIRYCNTHDYFGHQSSNQKVKRSILESPSEVRRSLLSRSKTIMSKSGFHWEPSGLPLVNVREEPEGRRGSMVGRVVARRADRNRRRADRNSERNGCCSSSPLYKRAFQYLRITETD